MKTWLTSREAARATGVAPSTFRAYVARGQAPQPRWKIGNTNQWALSDLQGWRDLEVTGEARRAFRVDAARKFSRFRYWDESTRRDLAQIGLNQAQSQLLIDGVAPGGIPVQTYRDARHILEVRRTLRRRIAASDDFEEMPDTSESDLLRAAANRVANGEEFFDVRADLTLELVNNGYPERMLPPRYDLEFWQSQESADDFYNYLTQLEKTDVPEMS